MRPTIHLKVNLINVGFMEGFITSHTKGNPGDYSINKLVLSFDKKKKKNLFFEIFFFSHQICLISVFTERPCGCCSFVGKRGNGPQVTLS